MRTVSLGTAAAMGLAGLLATSAAAGGLGCGSGHGHGSLASECYQKVATPDVYQTVARRVVVQPARSEVVYTPAVMGSRTQRVQTSPGSVRAEHVPAQYGHVEKSVMVRPASVSYATIPASYRNEHHSVVVKLASWQWQRSVDRHGRETMCKVHRAGRDANRRAAGSGQPRSPDCAHDPRRLPDGDAEGLDRSGESAPRRRTRNLCLHRPPRRRPPGRTACRPSSRRRGRRAFPDPGPQRRHILAARRRPRLWPLALNAGLVRPPAGIFQGRPARSPFSYRDDDTQPLRSWPERVDFSATETASQYVES